VPTVLPEEAVLRRAIARAARAPSVHNSQPWRWRPDGDAVDLLADPSPDGAEDARDVLLSCGIVLHHLLVALAGLGCSARVERFPDPADPDHLARVRPVAAPPSPGAARLAGAIAGRHTDRRRFASQPVGPDPRVDRLAGAPPAVQPPGGAPGRAAAPAVAAPAADPPPRPGRTRPGVRPVRASDGRPEVAAWAAPA
jgi:hypothetical protein